jgi:hypothetical protein
MKKMFSKMVPRLLNPEQKEHAANLRHGANSFTSLPNEGMLRIFSPGNF